MEQNGYYSLVQYIPDLSRLEGVNIGVLLYSENTCQAKVRLLESNRRISHFFGKQNWTFIDRMKESLRSRLEHECFESKSELELFIARRANAIQLTPLKPINIEEVDRDLARLYMELVAFSGTPRKKRIDSYLGEQLFVANVRNYVKKKVAVHFPFFDEPIRAPYGYQNGRFNLLAPVQFENDLPDVMAKAGQRALEGKILYENPDPELGQLRLNVIARFPEELGDGVRRLIEEVLNENQVRVFNFDDLSPLIKDIQEAAEQHTES